MSAFKWLQKQFSGGKSTAKRRKKKKAKHTIRDHSFYYVPQAGEGVEGSNILAELRRGRKREMEGAAGMHTMDNFDFRATGTVGHVEMRWLSHSCSHCLKADFEKCDKKRAHRSDNSARMLVVNEKNYSGASEGIAILKERMAEALLEVKVGNFVALWTGQNNKFQLAKVAKPIRKAKLGEVINGQPTNHGQYHVVEVEWGDQVRQGASETDLYKFETSELCANVLSTCGTAVGCKKRHTDLVYADVILPPFDLRMVSQATGGSRRVRKRQRKEPAAQTNKPGFWMLPAGAKQKILTTISSDVQAGVSYSRYT
jgi:hypothetical protein